MADYSLGFPPGRYRDIPTPVLRPRFEVGQLWQCEGRDTWRVIGASADGMIATLQVLAHAGRRTDGYATMQIDQREWLTAARWCAVPQARLMGGEVLR